MPNIERKPIVKNIYNKDSNSSAVYSYPIGVESCYSSLKITKDSDIPNTTAAQDSITSPYVVYEDNVQAELERKGCQINQLKTTCTSLSNKIIRDSDVNLSSTTGYTTFVYGEDSWEKQESQDVKTLSAAIPYLRQADPGNSTKTIPYPSSVSREVIGEDTLQSFAQKYNAFYNDFKSVQNDKDKELIERYYVQKERYKVYNSNIVPFRGYPIVKNGGLDFNGHMRYKVFKGDVTTQTGTPYTKTFGEIGSGGGWSPTSTAIQSTYSGPVITGTSFQTDLLDAEKLPAAPEGYKWDCVFARGTTNENNSYQLWQVLDGYNIFNGLISSSSSHQYLNVNINIPNLYKGTSFDNFAKACQNRAHFSAITLNSNYNNYDEDAGGEYLYGNMSTAHSIEDALNLDNFPVKMVLVANNNSTTPSYKYLYTRIGETNQKGGHSGYYQPSFTQNGTKNNPQDNLTLKLNCYYQGGDMLVGGSYFLDPNTNLSNKASVGIGSCALKVKNFFVTLFYNQPFTYAEYVLIKQNETNQFDWFEQPNINPSKGNENF